MKANLKTGLLIEPHYLERNKFARDLPTIGDNITITGSITDGKSDVAVFLLPETGGNTLVSDSLKTVSASNSSFNFTYTIPNITAGSYLLGISSSLNGSWTYYNAPLFVIY